MQCRKHRRQSFNHWVAKTPWRRKWHPTPVFLPGKSHGQRSLEGYSPMGSQRVGHDWATKRLSTHTHLPSYWIVLISVLSVFYIQAHCQICGLWIVYICKDDLTFNFLNASFEKQKVLFLGSLIYQTFSFMIHASCALSKNSLYYKTVKILSYVFFRSYIVLAFMIMFMIYL